MNACAAPGGFDVIALKPEEVHSLLALDPESLHTPSDSELRKPDKFTAPQLPSEKTQGELLKKLGVTA